MLQHFRIRWKEAKNSFYLPHYFPLAAIFFCFSLSLFAAWSLFTRVNSLNVLKEKVAAIEAKRPLMESIPQRERDLQAAARKADPRYLECHLQAMRLARLEAYSLETSKENLSGLQTKRLRFLMGPENTLHFLPGKTLKSSTLQAVEMKLEHPVEVDEKDVQRILAHIEGSVIGPYAPADHRPPMAIKKFSLKRKKEADPRFPSYLFEIELWRREVVQNS